jgi:ectoine hydroxylase
MTAARDIYPSRVGGEARLLERVDPVVHANGTAESPLSVQEIQEYAQKGFLVTEPLFTRQELAVLIKELERLRRDEAGVPDEAVIREPGSNAVRSVFQAHKCSKVFDRLVRDARLLDVASYILGDDVYVHQSRLNYKPGFRGKEFYWHSDFETWHVEDGMPHMRALSVSISLSDNVETNGPLMLVPGSHLKFVACPGNTPDRHYESSLQRQEHGVPPDEFLRELVANGGIETVKAPAGTATFFDCNTMHGSNSNISPYPRSNVFIVYNSVSNRPGDPFGTDAPRPGFLAERESILPVQRVCGAMG